jgi:uncharacterized protein YdiU (UPF0061 family)
MVTISTGSGWKLESSYAELPQLFFTEQRPSSVPDPTLVIFNEKLAESLGLSAKASKDYLSVFAGISVPDGASPLAQAYAGHQFGYFTMLGDGRAVLLGEQITPSGDRYDIQLKGSGRTPYSRQGDGKATLGPMLREYIISEAMHALGIPSTRSLAVVTTGEKVARETFQPGAVLTRIAASHLRVGTFEYAANWGNPDDLRALADYTLQRHFGVPGKNPYQYLLESVIKRQAELIAKWQAAGFVHGVMNTDNMALSGETIDYGPCAFMDTYDPATVFSSIDTRGRYAYGNQPGIGGWNLARFAETLLPLLHDNEQEALEIAQDAISNYEALFQRSWLSIMRQKLGLFNEEPEDKVLIDGYLNLLFKYRADYTNAFLALTFDKLHQMPFSRAPEYQEWAKAWEARRTAQQETKAESNALMRRSNPAIIPRNHRVEAALDDAVNQGDYSLLKQLNDLLSQPYAHSAEQAAFAEPSHPSAQPYRTFCGT